MAHAAQLSGLCDAFAVMFEICRAYFYLEGKTDTCVEVPDYGKLCTVQSGTRQAAASWCSELRRRPECCGPTDGCVPRSVFLALVQERYVVMTSSCLAHA